MYRKTITVNGIKVISEEIDHVRSVSIGVWVHCGSRDELPPIRGAAHFIEHMLFKGTRKRSAYDIAAAIDSVGGIFNAGTGKETTSFYVKIPDYHLPLAIDVLADILTDSLFDPEEMAREKSVILQEIRMVEDTPDDCIHDFFGDLFWNGHPLGWPVLGTEKSVSTIQKETLIDFFRVHYGSNQLVLTAAGNLKHDELVRLVEQAFGAMPVSVSTNGPALPVVASRWGVLEKDLEQVHIIIGSLGHSYSSPARYAGFLMNAVLGGSASSRLFQEIREKRGLAYAIHSYLISYRDTGMFEIYIGTGHDMVGEVLDVVGAELDRLKAELLTPKELVAAKEQVKGNFLLSMESTDHRMTRLAKNEIYLGRHITPEETVSNIETVSADEVLETARAIFNSDILSIAAIGKVSDQDIRQAVLRDKQHI
jgi:predicted Zn-dependent peptidase